MEQSYEILAVDDDAAIVNILETTLTQAGYTVRTARDGDEACRLAETQTPHLIIMDVMMPRCSGLLATMRIRQHCNVPILMLSAKAEGSDRVLGLEAGADDYLVKPFYQQELLARVKALLRRYDALGSIRETHTENRLQVGDIALDLDTKLCPGGGHQHPGTAFSSGSTGKPFRVDHPVLRLPRDLLRLVCGNVHWSCPAIPLPEPAAGSSAGPGSLPAGPGAAVPDGPAGGNAHSSGPGLLGQCLSPALLCAGHRHPPVPAEDSPLGRTDGSLGHCHDLRDLHTAVHGR